MPKITKQSTAVMTVSHSELVALVKGFADSNGFGEHDFDDMEVFFTSKFDHGRGATEYEANVRVRK